jgi:hypothetical protein
METLDESSVVVAASHTTSADVDGESVILDLDDGVYYGLNSSGSRIWKKLQEKRTVKELIDEVTKEYDISRSECEDDILSLLQILKENNLINIIDTQKKK